MKRLLLFGIVSGFSLVGLAQNEIDSLWSVWNNRSIPDTSRLRAAHIISKEILLNESPDSALTVARMQEELAVSCQSVSWQTDALNTQANAHFVLGNREKSLEVYLQSLDLAKEGDKPHDIARAYNNLGYLYGIMNHNVEALKYYKLSLPIWEELELEFRICNAYQGIGIHCDRLGRNEEAILYHQKAIDLFNKMNLPAGSAVSYNNLGVVHKRRGDYRSAIRNYELARLDWRKAGILDEEMGAVLNIGYLYENLHQDSVAETLYQECLDSFTVANSNRGLALAYQAIGQLRMHAERYDEAVENLETSLTHVSKLKNPREGGSTLLSLARIARIRENNSRAMELAQQALDRFTKGEVPTGQASALVILGSIALNQTNYDLALNHGKRALRISESMGSVQSTGRAAELLKNIYRSQGNFERAFEMQELEQVMLDSIFTVENQRATMAQEFEVHYEKAALSDSLEFAKKEAVMEERSTKQQFGLIAAGGGLLLVIALAFAIYNGKKKSDELLLNILPSETAKELKEKGYADAKQFDEVTVLFTDFKGFTAISERLSAKELVSAIDECFKAFDDIMTSYGIEKIKTIGDAYMAAGGLPVPNQIKPKDVVKAALEMRDWMTDYKKRKGEDGFEIRIGVHTGPVVAGIVGIKKFQYDIWGDTVNTASRMESSGEVGKVNISEATYELLKDDTQFSFESRGKIEAKGKGEMEMYFVERSA